MDLNISIWAFLILLYWPWDSETRKYEAILKVPNGGRWGTWREIIFCPTGHINGFALKMQPTQTIWTDDTGGLNSIRLECTDGTIIETKSGRPPLDIGFLPSNKQFKYADGFYRFTSVQVNRLLNYRPPAIKVDPGCCAAMEKWTMEWWGNWTEFQECPIGNFVSFSLNMVEFKGLLDDKAVNNIQFSCKEGTILMGTSHNGQKFGPWSKHCRIGSICGIQAKTEEVQGRGDDATIRDMKFLCCV